MGLSLSSPNGLSSFQAPPVSVREKLEGDREEGRERRGGEMQRSRKREKAVGGAGAIQRSTKRERTISSCSSPLGSFLTAHPNTFSWNEEDVWTEVAKYLDGKALMSLGMTDRWFHKLMTEESIWRYACLRDLQVPPPLRVGVSWLHLYTSAFGGCHSYSFRQQEKHIDWMRIGAFFFDSPMALLTESLVPPPKLPETAGDLENSVQSTGSCLLTNVRAGIWIADLQLVRCPVCNLNTCEGTMQILDTRHAELFLEAGYKDGCWDYVDIGTHKIDKPSTAAAGAIFDSKHVYSPSSSVVFDVKSWVGQPNDWQPKARVTTHGVAVNTNLQPNEGLHVRFQVMRNGGDEGEVVSIRISQQLL